MNGSGRRRLHGSDGTALVTALILVFAFTSTAVILLARDYDDRISTRSVAQAVAFQAARAGAQQVEVSGLRRDGAVTVDATAARARAEAVGRELLAAQGEDGTITVTVDSDRVTVVVEIVDVIAGGFPGSRVATVRAEGSARAVSG